MSIVNNPRRRAARPAALEIAEEANALLAEANANTQAMIDTISAIIRAETIDDVVRATLDMIRKEFGWAYASYWTVDPVENVLVFSLESGRVDDEFQRLTRTARFREGEGLNGRSWRLRDLVHVADLGELHDCCRAPLARRAGIKTAIALPVMRDGQVDRHAGLLRHPGRGDLPGAARRAADHRPARLGQDLEAGQAGRADPDQADGRERAGQHDVRRPRPEDPVHEPAGRADAQAARGVPADQGRPDDRPARSTSSTRPPSISGGFWPTRATCRGRRRSTSAPSSSSCSSARCSTRTARYIGPMITWEVVTEKIETEKREAETGRRHPGGQPVAPGAGAAPHGPRRDHRGAGQRPRGVRLVVRVVLGGRRRGAGAAVRPGRGLGQRGVSPRDRRGAVPRGGGAQRPGLADARPGLRPRPGRDEELLARTGRPPGRAQVGRLLPDHAGQPGLSAPWTSSPRSGSRRRRAGSTRCGTWAGWSRRRSSGSTSRRRSTRPRRTWRPRSTSS